MSKSLATTAMDTSEPYRIVRTFDPTSFSTIWDVFLETTNGYVQVSRFDGVLDYNQGAIGDGEFFSWEFVPEHTTNTDTAPTGTLHLEQEYGPKRQHKLTTAASKVNGQWYVPVQKREDEDALVKPDSVALPQPPRADPVDAVKESAVSENRLVLDSVFGPLNLGYYDGLVAHTTGEMLPVEYDAYITDDYDLEVKLSSKTPGLVETYTPAELLFLLETGQVTLYLDDDSSKNTRTHLLADGREVLEPANARPW